MLPITDMHVGLSYSFIYFVSAGLGEFKLRDINDEINKLLREKGHWEDRIKELDGPDYKVKYSICSMFFSLYIRILLDCKQNNIDCTVGKHKKFQDI